MYQLTLIRHAKSSWEEAGQKDFDRPLNARGKRDAPLMAQWAAQHLLKPGLLVSSPALRAQTTARVFAAVLDMNDTRLRLEPGIYEASADKLLSILQSLNTRRQQVMLFGHNPGISELAHRLGECPFDELSTCALANFSLDVSRWAEIADGCGKLLHHITPKMLRQD